MFPGFRSHAYRELAEYPPISRLLKLSRNTWGTTGGSDEDSDEVGKYIGIAMGIGARCGSGLNEEC